MVWWKFCRRAPIIDCQTLSVAESRERERERVIVHRLHARVDLGPPLNFQHPNSVLLHAAFKSGTRPLALQKCLPLLRSITVSARKMNCKRIQRDHFLLCYFLSEVFFFLFFMRLNTQPVHLTDVCANPCSDADCKGEFQSRCKCLPCSALLCSVGSVPCINLSAVKRQKVKGPSIFIAVQFICFIYLIN